MHGPIDPGGQHLLRGRRRRRGPAGCAYGRWGFCAEANQVCQNWIRAVHAGGQFAPEPERDVDPSALPVRGLDQRATLVAWVIWKRIGELHERIRDVQEGPDGLIYVLTDAAKGRILRLSPK